MQGREGEPKRVCLDPVHVKVTGKRGACRERVQGKGAAGRLGEGAVWTCIK